MKPEEFTSFEDEKPEKGKYVIVTNMIDGVEKGEMTNVFLTRDVRYVNGGVVALSEVTRSRMLTHWKYV